MDKSRIKIRCRVTALTAAMAAAAGVAGAQEAQLPGELEEVVVLGKRYGVGESRAVFTVGKRDIADRPAGADITQALVRVPSVQVASGDSRGGSFSFEIYMRGLSDEQIGFSLDGIPTGDTRFNGGSPPNRFADSNNIREIIASQSAGDVGSPTRSALGGFIEFKTDDPGETFGMDYQYSRGSFEYERNFLRIDSGELAPGLSAYLSFSDQSKGIHADDSIGVRASSRQHMDLKVLQQFDGGSSLAYRLSYNELEDNDFNIVTLDQFGARPTSDFATDTLSPDANQNTNYGPALGGEREDLLTYFNIDLMLSDSLSLSLNPYYHELKGESFRYQNRSRIVVVPGETTFSGNPRRTPENGLTLLTLRDTDGDGASDNADMRVTPRNRERHGLTADATYAASDFLDLRFGAWYEDSTSSEDRNFYPIRSIATGIEFDRGALQNIGYENAVDITTLLLFGQARFKFFDDKFKLDIGFTHHDLQYDVVARDYDQQRFSRYSVDIDSGDVDTKLGGAFAFSDELEVFAGFSKNFSGIPEDAFLGANVPVSNIEAEASENYDLGLRYVADNFAFSVQAFRIDFSNRVSQVPIDPASTEEEALEALAGNVSNFAINSGGIDVDGFELTTSYRSPQFDVYASYTQNDTEWSETLPDRAIVAGERVEGIAESGFYGELGWRPRDRMRLSLNTRYVGEMVGYASSRGAGAPPVQKVDDYTLVGLNATYTIPVASALEEVRLQLTIDNLFDRRFISAVTGATAREEDVFFQFPRYFIGYPRTLTFSLGAKF